MSMNKFASAIAVCSQKLADLLSVRIAELIERGASCVVGRLVIVTLLFGATRRWHVAIPVIEALRRNYFTRSPLGICDARHTKER